MKKVVFILVAFISIQTFSQKERTNKKSDLTPEQMATLRAKQMTLDLDLNEKQQEQVMAFTLKNVEELKKMKGERKELSEQEKYELKNKMLDNQIAVKKEMKNILNEEQYEKWQKMRNQRAKKMKQKKMQHHKKQKGKEKTEMH
ncbi:MAG: hypothetical protein BM563_06870 [Bacteroidetes bacterium MedPE-SWsnd-G1]|nr:MAG: hypothetical protein BM563_06870 [Bacteroidetes bacterium MedPE-SWsnd-G1]